MVTTPAIPKTKNLKIELPHELKLHVSLEQFAALAVANRDLRLERTATGELIVNPPTGWETGNRNIKISGELYLWWRDAGKPGKIFDSSTGFTLPNGAIRSPDAAWISDEQWQSLTEEQKVTFPHVCPDFVVELRSNSDTLKSLQEKMVEYVENGARLGWLINPQQGQVEVYQPGLSVEVLDNPMELSGGEVLPGFTLDLSLVWG